MTPEQLALGGMPEPLDLPAPEPEPEPIIDDEWAQALLDDPDAQAADLLRAFQVTELEPRRRDALLRHPRLANEDLVTAISGWTEEARDRAASAADNRALLEAWASSSITYERAVVAMNPYCPADLARMLASDSDPAVRMNAICCPQLPRSERASIANRDPDPDVREFARWLVTTVSGHDIIDGHRYAQAPDADEPVPSRVITYGISRGLRAPV